jgi:hypothetical protein
MKPITPCILFTVGTGTAGKFSNLAQGLVNSILKTPPNSMVGLVPSISPDSVGIAERVIEEVRSQREDIDVSVVARLSNPDNLLTCRREFRMLLQQLNQATRRGELTVNPTSGTKQMTAAATLACMDEGLGRLAFITGERADGAVKTGTEQLQPVDAARLLAEQRIRAALILLDHGDFSAAARLAALVGTFFPFAAAATTTLAEWHRLNYANALRAASGFEELAEVRHTLDHLRAAPEFSIERGADMLTLARRELDFDRSEEALSAIYRAVELLAKARLCELDCPPRDWFAGTLAKRLRLNDHLCSELKRMQQTAPDKALNLGLEKCLRLLEKNEFRLSSLDDKLRAILRLRNETRFGHGDSCVAPTAVRLLLDAVCARACEQWPGMQPLLTASRFPDLAPLIRKELDHE